MINQFAPPQKPDKYVVEVDLATYKLLQRLQTIDFSAEIHLYSDEKGRITSLRVIRAKEESLTRSSN